MSDWVFIGARKSNLDDFDDFCALNDVTFNDVREIHEFMNKCCIQMTS